MKKELDLADHLILSRLGGLRLRLADRVKALHDECGESSRALAEAAFEIYKNSRISLKDLALAAGMKPNDFRAIVWKYIGEEKIRKARSQRKLPEEVTP